MGAAARRPIESVDFHDTYRAGDGRRFAQGNLIQLLALDEPRLHRLVLEDDFVCRVFDGIELRGADFAPVQIDGAILFTQMERDSLRSQFADECLGQDVLAGVLLHMVAPAHPVYSANDLVSRQFSRDDVQYLTSGFVDEHVDNHRVIQLPHVVRLPAAGGVEVRLIQYDGSLAGVLPSPHDLCREFHCV